MDSVEAYLCTFEQTVYREGCPKELWAQALAPLLTEEAQLAYFSLLLALAEDYPILKEQILRLCGFSSCQTVIEFHHWAYWAGINPTAKLTNCSGPLNTGCSLNNTQWCRL